MSSSQAEDRYVVLRHPDLRRYLSARFIVSVATQIQTVAVGWQVFSVSGDPFDLGLVALSQFLPFIVLILPAGHVADRYDRRRVQLLTYVLLGICALALLLLSLAGVDDTAPVFGVMVLFGIARAFNQPTGQALLPNLAPIELFPRAVAVHSALGQVATIAGPGAGGALVVLGVEAAYALSVILIVAGVVLVAGLRGGGREERSREPVSWSTLLSGVTF
ncbi:MAG TPA: MFS transporter, partial [Candidatus Limnocylindria bacterium]